MDSWIIVLDTYPLRPGIPIIPKAPIKNTIINNGFLRPKPLISLRFKVCKFIATKPALINKTNLIDEWLIICNNAPWPARAPSSPKSVIIAIPTNIKPIWDIEEQASVLFKSIENKASIAPKNIVITAKTNNVCPQDALAKKMFDVMTIIP